MLSSSSRFKDEWRCTGWVVKVQYLIEVLKMWKSSLDIPCQFVERFVCIGKVEESEEWWNEEREVNNSWNFSYLQWVLRFFVVYWGLSRSSTNGGDFGDFTPRSDRLLESRSIRVMSTIVASNEKWRWRHLREIIDLLSIVVGTSAFSALREESIGGNTPLIDLFCNKEHLCLTLFCEVKLWSWEVTSTVDWG